MRCVYAMLECRTNKRLAKLTSLRKCAKKARERPKRKNQVAVKLERSQGSEEIGEKGLQEGRRKLVESNVNDNAAVQLSLIMLGVAFKIKGLNGLLFNYRILFSPGR